MLVATVCLKLMNTNSIIKFSRPSCLNLGINFYFFITIEYSIKSSCVPTSVPPRPRFGLRPEVGNHCLSVTDSDTHTHTKKAKLWLCLFLSLHFEIPDGKARLSCCIFFSSFYNKCVINYAHPPTYTRNSVCNEIS